MNQRSLNDFVYVVIIVHPEKVYLYYQAKASIVVINGTRTSFKEPNVVQIYQQIAAFTLVHSFLFKSIWPQCI